MRGGSRLALHDRDDEIGVESAQAQTVGVGQKALAEGPAEQGAFKGFPHVVGEHSGDGVIESGKRRRCPSLL